VLILTQPKWFGPETFFFGLSTANCNQQDERKKRKTIAHFRKRQQIEKNLSLVILG
jgi:hypothetical protein